MAKTDIITVGEPLPKLAAVSPHEGYSVAVTWANRARPPCVVDLAPLIFTFKLYKPLRDDPGLFRTVHLMEYGAGIAWGDDDAIDMDADSVERLAEEAMEGADFKAFLAQHKLTFESAGALLGVSKRTIAYWANGARIPRTVALACRWLDHLAAEKAAELAGTIELRPETLGVLPWSDPAAPEQTAPAVITKGSFVSEVYASAGEAKARPSKVFVETVPKLGAKRRPQRVVKA